MRVDYTAHFEAVAAAQKVCEQAKAEMQRVQNQMRWSAMDEATASLAAAGVELGQTLLTLKGKWKYQNRPILIRNITCWSAPTDTPSLKRWQLQAHYDFARKDGKVNQAMNGDYANVLCEHPTGFGSALLERFPLWNGRLVNGGGE